MEKINIVVSLILICFLLVILSIEKSKRTIENFYNSNMVNNQTNNVMVNNQPNNDMVNNQTNNVMVNNQPNNEMVNNQPNNEMVNNQTNNEMVNNQTNNEMVNNQTNNEMVNNQNNSNMGHGSSDINESQLMQMCKNMGVGPQAAIKTIRLSLNDLKALVKPAFWYNDNICFYRMERVFSLNQTIDLPNKTDDDYYYPVSDVMLFKNYNAYLNGELSSNSNNSNNNNSSNNNTNNNNLNNNNKNKNNSSNNNSNKNNNNSSNNNSNKNNNNSSNNNSNNNNKNNNNSSNDNSNNISSPSPSMVEMVNESLGEIVLGDNKVDDYNQPGVEGLKLMVKNGKKPLAYSPNPSCVIPGANGNNLFVWEPIPPENYICLGCVCTVSVRPTPPNVNECPIRCVPIECLDELQINLADDVKVPSIGMPYHLYQVSDGKFVKGTMDIPNQTGINIKSYEMKKECDNTELDETDNPITIKLHYKNTNITGQGPPQHQLISNNFNSVKGYYNKEFETFLINKPEIQLNDYPNNPPSQMDKPSGKRYIINSFSNENDKVQLFLSLNKRALGYNQLSGVDIEKVFASMINVHKISMRIYDKDFHLFLEKVEIANLYVFDPNKIDWEKTFIDPELKREEGKVMKISRGGTEYKNDPFKFNDKMDGFLKISNSMNDLEMMSMAPN